MDDLIVECDVCEGSGEWKHIRGRRAYSERCENCHGRGYLPNPLVIARLAALEAELVEKKLDVERLRTALIDERVRAACVADDAHDYENGGWMGMDAILDGETPRPAYGPEAIFDIKRCRDRAERSLAPILDPVKENEHE